ncbi:MAG: IS1634 family transposase [Methanosarcinales archaeon]|nr:MAG: IS1634 family transposase [Methanosarcinales archaeon]
MAWNITWRKPHKKKYGYLKRSYRVNGRVKTDEIYIGPDEVATKILADLATRELVDETDITYSGEAVLEKIADSLNFEDILIKYTGDERASRALKNVIILMTLFKESKRRLFLKRLDKSILKNSTDITYLGEVYELMDLVYKCLGDIMYDMLKNAIKQHNISLKYLLVDATRFKVYKDGETGLIKFGYSAQKRRDIPQVNLVLGVNEQQIPFFVSAHPGNTPDVTMFGDFLKTMRSKYRILNDSARHKIIIMDQGNVNEETIRYLRWLVRYNFHFLSMVRSSSVGRFAKNLDKLEIDLIYTREITKNKETRIYGKLVEAEVYGRVSHVLVCYNPDVKQTKNNSLDRRVEIVKQKVSSLNKKGGSLDGKCEVVNSLIAKHSLKRAMEVIKNEEDEAIKLAVNEEDLDSRRKKFGFFALFTHCDMTPVEMIKVYKSRDLVEKGFQELNTDFSVCPIRHSEDRRIETHTIFKIYGYFLVSILRAILKDGGVEHSFRELLHTIKSGRSVVGYYEHELCKEQHLHVNRQTNMWHRHQQPQRQTPRQQRQPHRRRRAQRLRSQSRAGHGSLRSSQ